MIRLLLALDALLFAGLCALPHAAPQPDPGAPAARGLWDAPANMSERDLYQGPWGAANAPRPDDLYTFVRPKEHGVNPGVIVRDSIGRLWHVKQAPAGRRGDEGPVEVVISRVLSAVGYHQPPVYFLPSFRLTDPGGAPREVPGGRFRLDEPSLRRIGTWSWTKNPFVGTRPFAGLLVILLMFNSWDLKDENNTLYEVPGREGLNRMYVVQDLGGALGETGRLRPRRNDIERFEQQTFITGAAGGFVRFAYGGKQPDLVHQAITPDDARWAGDLVAGLSDRQWADAFLAAGYPPDLRDRFVHKLKANILQARQAAPRAAR
jgi:hypothetical protein